MHFLLLANQKLSSSRPFVIVSYLTVVLSGCGGGGGEQSTPPPPPMTSGGVAAGVTLINGVIVPVDPGGDGKATLAGVDVNGNGVRDEVEREIAKFYGDTTLIHSAAMKYAARLQSSLHTPSKNQADAELVVRSQLHDFECLMAMVGSKSKAFELAEVVAARTYNTKARVSESTRIYDLSALDELPEIGAPKCD